MSTNWTFYNQCSSPWGSIKVPGGTTCAVGCGPTATAMVIKNITGANITPTQTVNYTSQGKLWYTDGGTSGPSNLKIGQNWGLKGNILKNAGDINEIKSVLNNGGLVMISGKGAKPFYTTVRHYVVIRGITKDNKFVIADPAGRSGTYSTKTIMGDAVHGIAFYKK